MLGQYGPRVLGVGSSRCKAMEEALSIIVSGMGTYLLQAHTSLETEDRKSCYV